MGAIASVGHLIALAFRNEHVRSAAKAAFRGATQELIRHLKTTYGGSRNQGSRQ